MGLERTAPIAIALLIFATGVQAGCKELAAAVDQAQKDVADKFIRNEATGGHDGGAYAAFAARALQSITANVMLMDRAKCPAIADPISPDGEPYWKAVNTCMAARDDAERLCNMANWSRTR